MKKLVLSSVLILSLVLTSVTQAATGQGNKPKIPRNGFNITIENGAEVTHDRDIVLLLNALNDVDRMAISLSEDFTFAPLIPYTQLIEYQLPEEEGEYTIYVKVYTRYGVASDVFSGSIVYRKKLESEVVDHKTIHGDVLKPGDLFKRSDLSAVYYYGEDKKRYVFPQESVFFSWFTVEDFNRIKFVNSQVLGSIAIGGNVVYRPGSVLVKVTSNDKVYAVGFDGELNWLHSETIAKQLYGDNWKTKVKDIPDTLFGNYTVKRKITRIQEPPEAMLFSMEDTAAVYILDDGFIRPFLSEHALNQNGYSLNQHIPELDGTPYPEGDAIVQTEFRYIDAAQLSN